MDDDDEKLQFVDYKKPRLELGDYVFKVQHHYGKPGTEAMAVGTGKIEVRAVGERIHIDPETVFAQYPPPGESGDFRDTLPHISFKKGSLPWMRSAYKESQDSEERYEPWLYLMLINQEDIARGDASTIKKSMLKDLPLGKNDKNIFFPATVAKSLQEDPTFSEQEKDIQTVEIKKSLFNLLILKNKSQIEYLAHVRRRFTSDATGSNTANGNSMTRELSVLIANRFGQNNTVKFPQGTRHYAMVVSLENYLDKDSGVWELNDEDKISLIVLHSWWFNCTRNPINFEQRVKKLNTDSLRLPSQRKGIKAPADIATRLDAGLTALPHEFRLGDRSISWYRGPLIPCNSVNADTIALNKASLGINGYTATDDDNTLSAILSATDGYTFSATDADKLLLYYKQDGMFDISYAAAYELGRFLSVNHSEYSKALARYKRGRARYITLEKDDDARKQALNHKGLGIKHLPYNRLDPKVQASRLATIKSWLLELARLEPLPSWYLVADSALVPPRSLRTFNIDPKWLQSLWLGALSLHARPKVTIELFKQLYDELKAQVSWHGMLLRSDIVWAYPQLVVDTGPGGTPIKISSNFRFAHDTHLYLTDKPFNYISLSLPPESLHYGADIKAELNNGGCAYAKAIKYNGKDVLEHIVPMNNTERAIVDITKLANELAVCTKLKNAYGNNSRDSLPFGSARIGRFMLEGEPKAEFRLGDENSRRGSA